MAKRYKTSTGEFNTVEYNAIEITNYDVQAGQKRKGSTYDSTRFVDLKLLSLTQLCDFAEISTQNKAIAQDFFNSEMRSVSFELLSQHGK